MSDLGITTHVTNAGVLLELTGELDFATAPQVRETLTGLIFAPGQQLISDLSGLRFCDSSGIAARNRTQAANAALVLAAVPDKITRVFRVVGLGRFLAIHPTPKRQPRLGPPLGLSDDQAPRSCQ